jgi:hypothetical protein
MKINETQMAFLALIVIGLLYLYNNPKVVYKNKPVYYPVYETEYPFNRNLNMNRGFRPDPRGRMPRPHHNRSHNIHNRSHKIRYDKNHNPVPGSGGGGI